MASYKAYYKASTKEVKIRLAANAAPAGFTLVGAAFTHNVRDPDVIYNHVRDELYKIGVLNMQELKLIQHFEVTPATAAKAPEATQQLTMTMEPGVIGDDQYTFATSDAEVATVNGAGLITAVANGEATITVRSVRTGLTDTCVVTVATP